MWSDFISLFFPEICLSCGEALYKSEKCLCSKCIYLLPKTQFHLYNDNPVAKLFWGRANIKAAGAYYLFSKGSKVQNLIHQLKYKGQTEAGVIIGKLYGYELKKSALFQNIDLVIPVPLHEKKLRERGYNQCDFFARGLAQSMKTQFNNNLLFRNRPSQTQTRKSRYGRWKNVEYVFGMENSEQIADKHILLVDDVVTTGSTLEACTQELLKSKGATVSIATIAYAEQ